jgi:hypothetical protein
MALVVVDTLLVAIPLEEVNFYLLARAVLEIIKNNQIKKWEKFMKLINFNKFLNSEGGRGGGGHTIFKGTHSGAGKYLTTGIDGGGRYHYSGLGGLGGSRFCVFGPGLGGGGSGDMGGG